MLEKLKMEKRAERKSQERKRENFQGAAMSCLAAQPRSAIITRTQGDKQSISRWLNWCGRCRVRVTPSTTTGEDDMEGRESVDSW